MSGYVEIFERYYKNQFWGNAAGCSGPNSDEKLTPILRENLAKLFEKYEIDSISDAGCGDANLFRYMDIDWIEYFGTDCVPSMIATNKKSFKNKENMQFSVVDSVRGELPAADIIISRDVAHYLPNDLIWQMLKNFVKTKSKHLLITHNLFSSQSAIVILKLEFFVQLI